MNRKEFIRQAGLGALVICSGCAALSCTKETPEPQVDFTVDLKNAANATLNTVGGSLSENGVIIVCIQSDQYVAFNRACPHAGTAVNFQKNSNNFLCPNHFSEFDINGSVTKGPAASGLKKYNVELTVTSTTRVLRIFS